MFIYGPASSLHWQAPLVVTTLLPPLLPLDTPSLPLELLPLLPSSLRPHCRADQRLFLWHGVNTPPPLTLQVPVLEHLASLVSTHSLCDPSSYGAGICKFHVFCDIFSVPEPDCLPASFALLNSFALWAAADPTHADFSEHADMRFEPVAPTTVRKYLSAIAAWHIVQG